MNQPAVVVAVIIRAGDTIPNAPDIACCRGLGGAMAITVRVEVAYLEAIAVAVYVVCGDLLRSEVGV